MSAMNYENKARDIFEQLKQGSKGRVNNNYKTLRENNEVLMRLDKALGHSKNCPPSHKVHLITRNIG